MFNKLWAIGRHSEVAYLRFYPNFGFMIPLKPGLRLVWNLHDGFFTRQAGSRTRPEVKRAAI